MIPIQSLEQFTRHDGWLADAKILNGFKIAESPNKLEAPHRESSTWEWHSVHKSEIARMKQTYSTPDLVDPIRCSYLTLTTEVADKNTLNDTGYKTEEFLIDVEPCQTYHDRQQQLHTLWIGQQQIVIESLENGKISDALGMDHPTQNKPNKQLYFDGRFLYNLPWSDGTELTDEFMYSIGARQISEDGTMWLLKTAAVSLNAAQGWDFGEIPLSNMTLIIYRSNTDASIWGTAPPTNLFGLDTLVNLSAGIDGMDRLDKELTLTLDFALDAARVVGRWCGAGSVDALELPKAMIALQTVNLSNLHPSERALTPISLSFRYAIVWLMGRAKVCETPTQCLDFRTLFSDVFMRKTCMSARRLEIRKEATRDQSIPQLDLGTAAAAAAQHIRMKEQSRQKRHKGLISRNKAIAQKAEAEHAAKMVGRRTRRGPARRITAAK